VLKLLLRALIHSAELRQPTRAGRSLGAALDLFQRPDRDEYLPAGPNVMPGASERLIHPWPSFVGILDTNDGISHEARASHNLLAVPRSACRYRTTWITSTAERNKLLTRTFGYHPPNGIISIAELANGGTSFWFSSAKMRPTASSKPIRSPACGETVSSHVRRRVRRSATSKRTEGIVNKVVMGRGRRLRFLRVGCCVCFFCKLLLQLPILLTGPLQAVL
jgi:hypothetical protein